MPLYVIGLRIVHILLGAFWVGAVLFITVLLQPSVQAAGSEGVRVMLELRRRRYMDVLILFAALTIVSGGLLLWRDSAGFDRVLLTSAMGLGLQVGAMAALAAFVLGVLVIRPAVLRMGELGAAMATADPESRPAISARMQVLGGRLTLAGRCTAGLVAVAITAMAVARYL
jgi:uncharacterized membrane protein